MASLKEIRTRIGSVISTKQVTSAMKMVSAAKLRKAQDAIQRIRPYANKLHQILSHVSTSLDVSSDNPYAQQRKPEKILLVAICSNRGLCGAFNANIVKKAVQLAETEYAEQNKKGNVSFVVIGKKAYDLLRAKNIEVEGASNDLYNHLKFDKVAPVAEGMMQSFKNGTYDRIILIYNEFKNAAVQNLQSEQFLPVEIEQEESCTAYRSDYIFEPSKKYIVEELIPMSLKTQLYKALLDSHASEHGARMTAMHQATDNASELLKELKLHYNKARQTAITNEILEIVGGAEALSN